MLVPLIDGRDHELEAVRSWTREQTCARSRFEVVLVANGRSPALESELQGLLSPHDQLVRSRGSSQQELHRDAVGAARGSILLFTEQHCLADAGCVQQLLERFADGTLLAASLPSGHIAPSRWAAMEALLFDRNKGAWQGPDSWQRVMLRGFAIRRETLEQVGGLDARLGFFADTELASRLHLQGIRVELLSGAGVRHVGQLDYAGVREAVESRIEPECAYRLAQPAAHCDKYFGELPQQSQVGPFRRRQAASDVKRLLLALARAHETASAFAVLEEAARRLPFALFGVAWLRLHYALRLAAARCRFHLWFVHPQRQVRAFGDVWARLSESFALNAFLRADAPTPVEESDRYVVAQLREPQLIGFHGVQERGGRSFRWTRPISSLRVAVRRADVEVGLELARAIADAPPRLLGLYWNDTDLLARSVSFGEGGALRFPVPAAAFVAGMEQRLTIVCDPIVPWRSREAEGRRRGLPLVAVEVRRAP